MSQRSAEPENPLLFPRLIVLATTERGTITVDILLKQRRRIRHTLQNQESEPMGNVVGYVRISKDEADSRSIDTQEHAIREWCLRLGHQLVSIHRDEGISGAVPPMDRKGAAEAITEARKRGNGILLVSKLDRVSRDLRDVLGLVDDVLGHRATLMSISESFDASTPSGRMFLQLLGTFGEFERNKIRERTREALATRRREGRKTGGKETPFGYKADKAGMLKPEKAEQATLSRARELRATGDSWEKVAVQLNAENRFRRGGKPWNRVKLYEVITADDRRKADTKSRTGNGGRTS